MALRASASNLRCENDACLKRKLAEGFEVDLINFDHGREGKCAETVAVSHGMSFEVDDDGRLGSFRKQKAT
jgi:hypothetical protein